MKNSESNLFAVGNRYQVDFVFNCKIINGKALYLVKWSNLPIEKATWQKQEHIIDALDKVADFLRKLEKSSYFTTQEDIMDEIILEDDLKYNPYQLTNYQGHFLYGDLPYKVKNSKTFETQKSKKIFILIEWQTRKRTEQSKYFQESFQPRDTWVEMEQCIEHAPDFITAYLQRNLVLNMINQRKAGIEQRSKKNSVYLKQAPKLEVQKQEQRPRIKVTINYNIKKELIVNQSQNTRKENQYQTKMQIISLVDDSDSDCMIIEKKKIQ